MDAILKSVSEAQLRDDVPGLKLAIPCACMSAW